jgi:hypothetical protein
VRGELAVELGEQADAVGEAILGAGRGEREVLRRRCTIDDESRPRCDEAIGAQVEEK